MNQISADEALRVKEGLEEVKSEISKAIVGHQKVIEEVLVCLLTGGHALLEGVPGLGKTYLIKTLGDVLDLSTSRIQFTPDLMPADIIGTNVLIQGAGSSGTEGTITFRKGPIFTNVLLADEINRATPKTQSALLEAMQEQNVTVGGNVYPLDPPFIVLATQNPIEMEGTYPLPEAQMDRFFFKLKVSYPTAEQISSIIDRTTTVNLPELNKKLTGEQILSMRRIIREVALTDGVKRYAVNLVLASHPDSQQAKGTLAESYVRYGSSPRGAQSLILAGKVFALMDGRFNVSYEDIKRAAEPALRHRIILSFEGEAEGITTESVIANLLEKINPEKD